MGVYVNKKEVNIGDRGFIVGDRFIPTKNRVEKIPEEGLIFYASLKNSIDAESGHEGNGIIKSYEFVTEDGIDCIKSNSNNAVIQYPTWEEITGNNSLSMSFWIKGKCEHQDDNIITYGKWATDSLRAARFMGSGNNALLGCESGDAFV